MWGLEKLWFLPRGLACFIYAHDLSSHPCVQAGLTQFSWRHLSFLVALRWAAWCQQTFLSGGWPGEGAQGRESARQPGMRKSSGFEL